MTSLLVWFASDVKTTGTFRPASVYIASDSRITWDKGETTWDRGKKVFASATKPEIFGYCGDTTFAAVVLSQVIGAIDGNYLFHPADSAAIKFSKVQQIVHMAWDAYPKNKLYFDTHIIHVSREGEGVSSTFWLQEHVMKKKNSSFSSELPTTAPLNESSRPWIIRGTGEDSVNASVEARNKRYADRHTSRTVFKAFCEALRDGTDPNSGGVPQLASLYRIGVGRPHGVIWNNCRYFEGLPTIIQTPKDAVPWRNDSFEIVNQRTKIRKKGAAKQPDIFDFGGV